MGVREAARSIAGRVAPGLITERARRHERRFREREGVTSLAHRVGGAEPQIVGGPFAGMRYPARRLADVNAPVAKLVGAYEDEILDIFTGAVERGDGCFVDIGCADGYFAVGMAVAVPGVRVFAYDLAGSAREVCGELAALNGVSGRVHVGRRFDAPALDAIPAPDLVLCDIEGAERDLFTPELAERLSAARVVVEVHEFSAPGTAAHLRDVFAATHDVRVVEQRRRDPAAYPQLRDWTAAEQQAALAEHRPADLHWVVFSPR